VTVRIAGDSCYGHIVGRASDDCNVECEEKLYKEECPGQFETGMSDFLTLDSMRALCVEWFWKKLSLQDSFRLVWSVFVHFVF